MGAKSTNKFLCVNVYLALTISQVVCDLSTHHITNGDFVQPMKQLSYYAIVRSSKGSCGGTIISDKHILTAAHCVNGNVQKMPKAYTGSKYRGEGEEHEVKRYWIHPGYQTAPYHRNDVAVLELKNRIEFDSHQNSIPLPVSAAYVGEMATISGWAQDENARRSLKLKSVDVPIIRWEECRDLYRQSGVKVEYQRETFCTKNDGKEVLFGDSGGPVVQNGVVVGIASHYISRNRTTIKRSLNIARDAIPDTHTNVIYFVKWIKQCMNASSYQSLERRAIHPR